MKERVNTKGLRTCVACRKKDDRRNFLTFRCNNGILVLDEKRNIAGKGMNLCKNVECFDLALKKKSFGRKGGLKKVPEGLRSEFLQIVNS